MRERVTLFAALLGVVALVSGLGVGLVGYLSNAATQGVRVELGARTGADMALQFSLDRIEGQTDAQDERMRALILRRFAGVPVSIDRTVGGTSSIPLTVPAVS